MPDEPARDADASTATASTPDVAATPAASSQQAPEPGPDANAPEATVASPRTAPNLRGSASAAFAGHGLTPLLPTEPSLGLAAILERDAVLNVPKGRLWQLIAAGCGLFGLFLAVVGAARHRAGIDVPLVGPIRLAHLGLILAMLAVWAFLTIRTVAGDKVLRIPLAPSQGDQWEEVQSQARLMQFGQWIGMGGAVAGLGILALSLRFIPGGGVVVGAGLGGAMAVGSLALILFMEARRGPLRQVYVQTLLLSRLEEAGVSSKLALDPRTAEVLRAVDRLLADLPESAVRRFMSTDQAQKYIELVEKAHRGGPDARR